MSRDDNPNNEMIATAIVMTIKKMRAMSLQQGSCQFANDFNYMMLW